MKSKPPQSDTRRIFRRVATMSSVFSARCCSPGPCAHTAFDQTAALSSGLDVSFSGGSLEVLGLSSGLSGGFREILDYLPHRNEGVGDSTTCGLSISTDKRSVTSVTRQFLEQAIPVMSAPRSAPSTSGSGSCAACQRWARLPAE